MENELQETIKELESVLVRSEYYRQTIKKAIMVLKSFLPIAPAEDGQGCLICGNQLDGCGVVGRYDTQTGKVTEKYDNYCAFCGRKVKWNG